MAKRNKKNDTSFEQELRVSFAKEYNELKLNNPWVEYQKAFKNMQLQEKKVDAAREKYMELGKDIWERMDEYHDKISALNSEVSNWAEFTAIQHLIKIT